MNLEETLFKGHRKLREKHDEEEATKVGTLRVGSSGIINEKGEVKGNCHRVAWLRSEGHNLPVETNKHLMFEAGETSELSVLQALQATELNDGDMNIVHNPSGLCVKEFEGKQLTGRPDIVITKQDKPILGIELKNISSIYTARSVSAEMSPKSPHLIQAGVYAWMMDVPYKLVYTNRMNWHINFNKHMLKAFGSTSDKICDHKVNKDGSTYPFSVIPHYTVYDVRWIDGRVCYSVEGMDQWTVTDITERSIEIFYKVVANLEKDGELGPRPSNKSVDGSKTYKACDYCKLKEVCDESEHKGLTVWKDHAILHINNLRKEIV